MDSLKRIVNDIVDINLNKPEDIFINFDKENFKEIFALIIGPKNTPYEDGYFLFKVLMPDDYPNSPPKINLLTVNSEDRLNPNLYACGKVCLSIINTWQGPKWTKNLTLKSLLLSIQSLMGEFPIRNEPGYESCLSEDWKSISYNDYVTFKKYKIAIIDILKGRYEVWSYFKDIIEDDFNKKMDNHIKNLHSFNYVIDKNKLYKPPIYFIKKSFKLDYSELISEVESLQLCEKTENLI